MKVIQVTLEGYDGSTDETDDKIVWIVGEDSTVVENALARLGVQPIAVDETSLNVDVGGIDFFLAEKPPQTIQDLTVTIQKELEDFINNRDFEMVDGLKRFNFSDPELIQASGLLAQKELLEKLGGIFENNPDFDVLNDNVDSWM